MKLGKKRDETGERREMKLSEGEREMKPGKGNKTGRRKEVKLER